MTKNTLIVRADASYQIGFGHVMRCLALSQTFLDIGGKVIFVMAMDAGPLFHKLENENIEFKRIESVPGSLDDAQKTISIALEAGTEWIVLDGYHFSAEYQKDIKNAGFKVLFVDDNCEQEHYFADIILNQNIHASDTLYPQTVLEPYTKLLLGLKYCLLRQEFLKYRNIKRDIPDKARKILIIMGGSDPKNNTTRVLKALRIINNPELEIKVVLGAANSNQKNIEKFASDFSGKVEIIVNAQDMPELMIWADLAISAAGSTVWEMSFLNLPFILVEVADNQHQIANSYIRSLPGDLQYDPQNMDPNIFCEVISRGIIRLSDIFCEHWQIDGKGSRRIFSTMFRDSIVIRNVTGDDSMQLWNWANDPDVRNNAFNKKPILLKSHQEWFARKLQDKNTCLFIGEINDIPFGQIRFDLVDEKWEIDVSISRNFRSMGLGKELIYRGVEGFLKKNNKVDTVVAVIFESNISSVNSFISAGFEKKSSILIDNIPCFILKKNRISLS